MVAIVTFDHNIVFHELESLKRAKQVTIKPIIITRTNRDSILQNFEF